MKIDVVFLLVGVSACYGHVRPPSGGNVPNTNCLETILKKDVKNLLAALQNLFCSYKNCKTNECSLEEWTQLLAEVKETMKDTGCVVDHFLLGGNPTVEKIAAKVGKALQQLRDPVRNLLKNLKIEEPVFDLLCELLGDLLLKVGELLTNLTDELNLGGITGGLLGSGGILSGGGLLGK
ncbi:ranaspumin-like [Pleurodeles waltl]|uniref:ranaspumin-like n=1 Tax=Pleurodeles waltl TaxID=8319 RepID=UPI00370953CE